MTKKIIITEEEVNNHPNDYGLGEYVRKKMNKSTGDEEVYIGEPRIDTIEYVVDDTHKFGFNVMVISRYE